MKKGFFCSSFLKIAGTDKMVVNYATRKNEFYVPVPSCVKGTRRVSAER